MRHSFRILVFGIALLAIVAASCLYGLFHGYFDHGEYMIRQSWRSPGNRIATVAERSDREALGGLEFYVLIGDHILNPTELRHAYYGDAVVFDTSSDCLTLRWDGADRLIVKCNGSAIDSDHINLQRKKVGDVLITYENIAIK